MILDTNVHALSSVMLVDDNEDDNVLHTRQLVRAGIVRSESDVLIKRSPKSALEFFAQLKHSSQVQQAPALALVDINMPWMNGFEFMERYAKLGLNTSTLFLILTSSTSPMDIQRAARTPNVSGLIVKPLDQLELRNLCKNHLTAHFEAEFGPSLGTDLPFD